MTKPNDVFRYVERYFSRKNRYPTLYKVAQRFMTNMDEIEQAIADYDGEGYIGIGVAVGSYSGIGVIEVRGDYIVEAYK